MVEIVMVSQGLAVAIRTDRSDMAGQGSLGMLSLGCIRSHEIWQSGRGQESPGAVASGLVWQSRLGEFRLGAVRHGWVSSVAVRHGSQGTVI